jgi:hypothetical protein
VTDQEYKQYRGLVVRAAQRHWYRLPRHVQTWYGLDDLVEDLALTVVSNFDTRYDPSRAKVSTFVSMVAQSRCTTIIGFFNAKRRSHIPELFDELTQSGTLSLGPAYEAIEAMERVIEYASDGLRVALSDLINTQARTIPREFWSELRYLVHKHHMSRRDFESVLSIIS